MVASNTTIDQVLKVVLKHTSEEITFKILDELRSVPGNKSFRDTIESLYQKHLKQK